MIHEVTAAHNNQTLFVSPGDVIRIQLEENPTTGYAWKLEETSPLLSVKKNDYNLFERAGIGSGGMRTIELSVEQSGQAEIQMKNWQRWSGDVYQSFELKIEST